MKLIKTTVVGLLIGAFGLVSQAGAQEKGPIGISMPNDQADVSLSTFEASPPPGRW